MTTSIAIQRNDAVREVVDAIREIEMREGVTRNSLQKFYSLLLKLVERKELFTEDDFPATTNPAGLYPLYRLSEDNDNRLAVYVNSSMGANNVGPHDHTTWAVTVSICGTEEN